MSNAGLARNREPPELGASDKACRCAERQRLHHIDAASDAAIEQHRDATVNGSDDGRECVDRRRSAVELPSAMV